MRTEFKNLKMNYYMHAQGIHSAKQKVDTPLSFTSFLIKSLNYFILPFRVIYKIYYLVFFIFSVILFFPLSYYLLSNPKLFPKAFTLIRFHAFVLLLFAGVILRIKGKENIPKGGAYIICSNHSSFLDPFCIYRIFQQYFVFIGKKEIEKWPLFHLYYTSGMNILVDRQSSGGALGALKRMSQEIDKGNPLMIFPEGTRTKNAPQMEPFKAGAFAIAIQKQVPVLPVTFVTNWKRLEQGGIWKGKAGPGFSYVVIHKPVPTTGLQKKNILQLLDQVQDIINGPFTEK